MQNSSIDHPALLNALIQELVAHIQYSNGFLLDLLKEVTLKKKAVIALDDIYLQLESKGSRKYQLKVSVATNTEVVHFSTKGDYLRAIVNGEITLDKAIATHKVFAQGSLEDLLGIYRLAIGLLVEGPTDPNLREIWNTFDAEWFINTDLNTLLPIDEQQVYNYFPFQAISSIVKNVEIRL